ncbi:MAG: hypothetical protein WBN55_12355, partial [Eudoraea sp.]|uniref:hypothetical protein n=1 Tax=Eudoraea sp. TaxID=1979955 RepID=UPI003C780C66
MKVNLRYRENKKKEKSYYLDYHINKERKREFLGIHISPKDTKIQQNEKLRTANIKRVQREQDILSGITGIQPAHLKNKSFKSYAENYLENYTKKD